METLTNTGKNDLHQFHADFWEDKVYINGKAFPTGHFIVELLNFYDMDMFATRVGLDEIWDLIDELERGFVRKDDVTAAKLALLERCAAIKKVPPFCYLDTDAYAEGWIDFLFRDMQYRDVIAYLELRKQQAGYLDPMQLAMRLTADEKHVMYNGQYLLERWMETLEFYNWFYTDCLDALWMAKQFSESLEDVKRFDEHQLITKAQTLNHYGRGKYGFPDVKQTIVLALLESLRRYKPDTGVPFLAFAKYKVRDDVRDFIRLNGGIFSIANANHYRQLAKANALYYKGMDEAKSAAQCKEEIASLMHIEYETVDALICEGMDFRSYKNERPVFERSLEDEHFSPIQAYEKGDRSADPGVLVPYLMAIQRIADTVETLSFKRRYVLYALAGIECIYCGRTDEEKTYSELANEFERYDKRRMEAFARETQIELHYMLPWWTQFVEREE